MTFNRKYLFIVKYWTLIQTLYNHFAKKVCKAYKKLIFRTIIKYLSEINEKYERLCTT